MSELITPTTATDSLLVVDDQEANIQLLGSMLGPLGFEIVPAIDSVQALKCLAVRKPDLILLDLIMPGMDGFKLCQRIKENPEWVDIPIIFLSTADDKSLIVRALESGGVDYITKPFNRLELVSRVRTQLMLKTARDHLHRLAQDKEELLGMISHHLQNHLVGLNMSAQMLLNRVEEKHDPKMHLMAVNIRNSSGQMRGFIRSFLANAAADHSLNIRLENLNLDDAVKKSVNHYIDAATAKELSLHLEIPAGNFAIRADAVALDQVLGNLISNAVKFSPPKKRIFVTVQSGSQHVECSVTDEGPGFTEEDKARMFNRYARLSARPTGGEPSTGLGLNIVKKLIHGMGGELECRSHPGQGTTFTLRLPSAKV